MEQITSKASFSHLFSQIVGQVRVKSGKIRHKAAASWLTLENYWITFFALADFRPSYYQMQQIAARNESEKFGNVVSSMDRRVHTPCKYYNNTTFTDFSTRQKYEWLRFSINKKRRLLYLWRFRGWACVFWGSRWSAPLRRPSNGGSSRTGTPPPWPEHSNQCGCLAWAVRWSSSSSATQRYPTCCYRQPPTFFSP